MSAVQTHITTEYEGVSPLVDEAFGCATTKASRHIEAVEPIVVLEQTLEDGVPTVIVYIPLQEPGPDPAMPAATDEGDLGFDSTPDAENMGVPVEFLDGLPEGFSVVALDDHRTIRNGALYHLRECSQLHRAAQNCEPDPDDPERAYAGCEPRYLPVA